MVVNAATAVYVRASSSWLLLLLVTLAAAGCDRASSADESTLTLRLAYVMSPGGSAHDAAEKLAELVETRSNGTIRIALFPGAQLGNDRELFESMRLGSVDMVLGGMAPIGWYVPEYGALESPFVYRDYDHLRAVLEGPIGDEMEAAMLQSQAVRVVDYWYRGPRYLTTTNRRVTTPADLAGLKLRVPELPTYIESWRALGANVTPVTYSEIFLALKQGVVEGQENPLEAIVTSSLFEVQNYVMETEHLLGAYMMMVAETRWSKLTEEQRALLLAAIEEAGDYEYTLMLEYEVRYRKRLTDAGMQFVAVDPQAFRHPVLEALPRRFADEWAPDLFGRIVATESAHAYD